MTNMHDRLDAAGKALYQRTTRGYSAKPWNAIPEQRRARFRALAKAAVEGFAPEVSPLPAEDVPYARRHSLQHLLAEVQKPQ